MIPVSKRFEILLVDSFAISMIVRCVAYLSVLNMCPEKSREVLVPHAGSSLVIWCFFKAWIIFYAPIGLGKDMLPIKNHKLALRVRVKKPFLKVWGIYVGFQFQSFTTQIAKLFHLVVHLSAAEAIFALALLALATKVLSVPPFSILWASTKRCFTATY